MTLDSFSLTISSADLEEMCFILHTYDLSAWICGLSVLIPELDASRSIKYEWYNNSLLQWDVTWSKENVLFFSQLAVVLYKTLVKWSLSFGSLHSHSHVFGSNAKMSLNLFLVFSVLLACLRPSLLECSFPFSVLPWHYQQEQTLGLWQSAYTSVCRR